MSGNEMQGGSDPTYTMGYSDEFLALLKRRNAENVAFHLLPRLKPGLRVLDLGCGPGTISVGLAKAVEPGELHGVDLEESQVEMARAAAVAGGHDNAFFRTGDATDLPYEDDFFDVVHFHAVLMHVPDTRTTLAEAKRVLKPGGFVSAREVIGDSSFLKPTLGGLDDVWATFQNLLIGNGGHPQIGKELKGILIDAGFSDMEISASFETFATDEDIAFFHALATGWFFAPDTIEVAVKHGLATHAQFDDWRRTLDEWKGVSGALAALAWGEAIGFKP